MMKRHETILKARSALLRAVLVILSLAVAMSGMAHAGGSHAGEHIGVSLAVTASHDAAPADSPCDKTSNHDINEGCPHAAGCAFGVPAQAGIAYEPLEHSNTVQSITEVQNGTAAAPPIRPPKFCVQA